ncbi:Glycerol-3-phosphate phosphatase [Armadillidium nasatum]|uniref:Glycerol-3-phosphate phosphatase n=1 Tax=Armadillidium nasatum TaxID=96803 RepID=A0A5N5TGP6_9CRUS|nr:Glycerol-3-phosphate phosphatase [Armadillidium nasatum]
MDENKSVSSKNFEKLSVNNKNILSDVENVFLDCDGVIWKQNELLNKANDVIKKLQDNGKNVFLVTNSSVITQDGLWRKCLSFGISLNKDCTISSATTTAQYLKSISFKKKIYVIGSQELAEELQSLGFCCVGPMEENYEISHILAMTQNGELDFDPEVGAVVVGLDSGFNYGKIFKASCYLTNPDCIFLGCSFEKKYSIPNTNYYLPESATGRKATIIGKPSRFIFDFLSSKFDLKPEKCLMVGDTIQTDIVFGNDCGMKTLLVLTGFSSLEDVEKVRNENEEMIPHYFIESLGDIYDLI